MYLEPIEQQPIKRKMYLEPIQDQIQQSIQPPSIMPKQPIPINPRKQVPVPFESEDFSEPKPLPIKGFIPHAAASYINQVAGGIPKQFLTAIDRPVPNIETGGEGIGQMVGGTAGFLTGIPLRAGVKLAAGTVKGGINLIKKIPQARIKMQSIAEDIVKPILKSTPRDIMHGNPARALSKEGINGNTIKGIAEKVKSKLDLLNPMLDKEYVLNNKAIANYSKVKKPLYELMGELTRYPKYNKPYITRLSNLLSDLEAENLNKLSPIKARQFRDRIDNFIDWNKIEKGDFNINIALKKVYDNINDIINFKVPQTKELNQRISDLISVRKILTKRIIGEEGRSSIPRTFGRVLDLPLKVIPETKIRTGISKSFSTKYPEFKTNIK